MSLLATVTGINFKELSISMLWWNAWPLLATHMPMATVSLCHTIFHAVCWHFSISALRSRCYIYLPLSQSDTSPELVQQSCVWPEAWNDHEQSWEQSPKSQWQNYSRDQILDESLFSNFIFVLSSFFWMIGTYIYRCTFCKCTCMAVPSDPPSHMQRTGQFLVLRTTNKMIWIKIEAWGCWKKSGMRRLGMQFFMLTSKIQMYYIIKWRSTDDWSSEYEDWLYYEGGTREIQCVDTNISLHWFLLTEAVTTARPFTWFISNLLLPLASELPRHHACLQFIPTIDLCL